jgi:hypothetical protein
MKMNHAESEKIKSLYFDSVDWELAKLVDSLVKQLPERSEMVSYYACHAFERNGNGHIENSVGTWFTFTLDGWKIDFMPDHFWAFDGIGLSAYRIINNTYQTDRYPLFIKYNSENDIATFLELLSNPKLLNSKQWYISGRTKSDREYVSRKRKIERVVYTA